MAKKKIKIPEAREFRYVKLTPRENSIVIELTEDGKEEIEDISDIYELFDDVQGNSEYEYHEDGGESGFGMTNAPIITDGYYMDDDGEYTTDYPKSANIYYYNDYMILDPFEVLKENGSVVYQKAEMFEKGGEIDGQDPLLKIKADVQYKKILKDWLEDNSGKRVYQIAVCLLRGDRNVGENLGIKPDNYDRLLSNIVRLNLDSKHDWAIRTLNYTTNDLENWATETLNESFELKSTEFAFGGTVNKISEEMKNVIENSRLSVNELSGNEEDVRKFLMNDTVTYENYVLPTEKKNLDKIKKGTFDIETAPKSYNVAIEVAVKRYEASISKIKLTKAERDNLARHLVNLLLEDIKTGAFEEFAKGGKVNKHIGIDFQSEIDEQDSISEMIMEYVADMVEQGYTEGDLNGEEPDYRGYWKISIKKDKNSEESRNMEVARLLRDGNTSGYNPTFTFSANVWVDEEFAKGGNIPSNVEPFLPSFQKSIIKGSSEHESVLSDLSKVIGKMPRLYGTEDIKLKDKVIYLHYFYRNSDWYIAEQGEEGDDNQESCFGYAILNGDTEMAEWGYISIQEIVELDKIELDLYFTPTKFSELQKKFADGGSINGLQTFNTAPSINLVESNSFTHKHQVGVKKGQDSAIDVKYKIKIDGKTWNNNFIEEHIYLDGRRPTGFQLLQYDYSFPSESDLGVSSFVFSSKAELVGKLKKWLIGKVYVVSGDSIRIEKAMQDNDAVSTIKKHKEGGNVRSNVYASATMQTADGEIIGDVRWNSYWGKYQVSIDGSLYGEYDSPEDAIDELERSGFKDVAKLDSFIKDVKENDKSIDTDSNEDEEYNEEDDLFLNEDDQPDEVKAVLAEYEDYLVDGADYPVLAKMLADMEAIGYTFEYGLDAEPFNLRKIEKKEKGGTLTNSDYSSMTQDEREILQLAKNDFFFLLKRGVHTYREFAELIKDSYSLDNPRTKAVYDMLMQYPDSKIEIKGRFAKGGNIVDDNWNARSSDAKNMPVKKLDKSDEALVFMNFPSFDASGSVSGMKKKYYGKGALLVECDGIIYNVSSEPSIYNKAKSK